MALERAGRAAHVASGSAPVTRAEPQVGALELLAQRHDDVARLERARRRARQQRRVEHEVDVVDQRDLRARCGGQLALERARGVEPAEAAAGDDDAARAIGADDTLPAGRPAARSSSTACAAR